MNFQTIVVTDLDGTLLDHHTYSFMAAKEAIERLSLLGIPLVLNSSKTAAEIQQLRYELGNRDPYIVENGAGIYVPEQTAGNVETCRVVKFGMNRADILSIIGKIRRDSDFAFTGFADMSPEELAGRTGLSPEKAALAQQRDFTEPLLWQDTEERLAAFTRALEHRRLSVVRGGRFVHVSARVDKSMALQWLRGYYTADTGDTAVIIALGDGENDCAMLEAADYPVLVRSPVNPLPKVRHDRLKISELEGPAGWNKAVNELLDKLGFN